MDWLKGMNDVLEFIEDNLSQPIQYESLSKILGCSVYEFSRIFSFMAGMPVSEYIRRRRLSQAVFDIQNGREKIIDIALKYGYESPTAFTRAFKELHGTTPMSARRLGVVLKTYPPISFVLTIKGVEQMKFRIEKRECFQIMGLSDYESSECLPGDGLTPLWRNFMDHYNAILWNNGESFYTAPFWQVAAYQFESQNGLTKAIIGAEFKDKNPAGLTVETIPAAEWVVFTINSRTGFDNVEKAYTRILTEWFPQSQYSRDTSVPHLEVFPGGNADSPDYEWEIWVPVKNR